MTRLFLTISSAALVCGVSAASVAAKTCEAPIKTGGTCVAICPDGCGVHVKNEPAAGEDPCSRYCFGSDGRQIDNVVFDKSGRAAICSRRRRRHNLNLSRRRHRRRPSAMAARSTRTARSR